MIMKLTLAAGILFASVAAGAAITDEDVVRMFVSGSPVEEIISVIKGSEVDFDLSDEMVYELRAAGLPQELIGAMIARQEEMQEDEEPPHPILEEPSGPLLRIEIDAGKPLRILDVIDGATRERLRLRRADSRFTDVAIFLACLTQDHVPDNWRGKSPMGRDFISMPRHRMLHFHSGAASTEIGKWRKFGVRIAPDDGPLQAMLVLGLPSTIEVGLTPGVAHDLMLGVALRAEEKYHLAVFEEIKGLVAGDEEITAGARVGVGKDHRHSSISVQLH
jgi:hypothetical protein